MAKFQSSFSESAFETRPRLDVKNIVIAFQSSLSESAFETGIASLRAICPREKFQSSVSESALET